MSQTNSQAVTSELIAEDPDLRALVEMFAAELPDRLESLAQAQREADFQALSTLAHQLKGAGGSYGYPQLTELGAEMEQAFKQQQDDAYDTYAPQLEALINAIQAGLASE